MSARLQRLTFTYLNAGDVVLCELCAWRGKRFLNSHCPHCNSMPRHRLIPYAVQHFGLDLNERALLHFGANRNESRWLAGTFHPKLYLRADICTNMVPNILCDAHHMPFATESVDVVIAWHVLEHVPDDRRVLREMRRVLRRGGRCLVSVPIYPAGRSTTYENATVPRAKFEEVYGHPDHVRACGLDYGDRLSESGFVVRELRVKDIARTGEQGDIVHYGLSQNHVAWCGVKD